MHSSKVNKQAPCRSHDSPFVCDVVPPLETAGHTMFKIHYGKLSPQVFQEG